MFRQFPGLKILISWRLWTPLVLLICLLCWKLNNAGVSNIRPQNISDQNTQASSLKVSTVSVTQSDWPQWRGGINHQGSSDSAQPPLTWNTSENILFNIKLAGEGHASPIVCQNICYLQSANQSTETQLLQAVYLNEGKILWTTELHRGSLPEKHQKNSHASATPACDGAAIYTLGIHLHQLYASKISLEGKIIWQKSIGPYSTEWGYGSSPVYHQGRLFVLADQRGSGLDRIAGAGFVAAIDCNSGEILWRTKRTTDNSYGTPVYTEHPAPQIIIPGSEWITAYNPQSGEELWKFKWGADRAASTPVIYQDLVIASTLKPKARMLAVKIPVESSNVTVDSPIWENNKQVSDIPSPLVYRDRLYIASDNGILSSVDITTGKVKWMKRIGGNFSSSPIAANGRIYATSEEGKTFVIAADDEYQLLAENDLKQPVLATPALVEHKLLIRTPDHLLCISEKQPQIASSQSQDHSLNPQK